MIGAFQHSPKIILNRPPVSSGGGTGTFYREKPAIQTSTGIFYMILSNEVTNNSEVILWNGVELEQNEDYIMVGTKVIFNSLIDIRNGDKLIIRYNI